MTDQTFKEFMEKLKTNAHRLSTFAFHVHTLTSAQPDDKFTLSFWGNVKIAVIVQTGNIENIYILNGENCGNVHGAIKRYSELCAQAFS